MKLLTSLVLLSACTAAVEPDDVNMQAGSVQLDNTGFFDDGGRWWTDHSALTLTGTYDGSPDARIDVQAGGSAVPAVLDGTRWTAQLPDGVVTADDTLVTVMMTEPGGAHATRQQLFALDVSPPVITPMRSPFRGENADVVTYDDNGAVHDHQGYELDLTEQNGCVPVQKYAYLTDTTRTYGRELSPNPLRWNLTIEDAKVAAAEYRISVDDGDVVRDWAPLSGNGIAYPVELHREQNFLNEANRFRLDVRARDWAGHESSSSFCFLYMPLAAPLQVDKPVVPTADGSLASWTLAANSPVSQLISGSSGPVVFEQRIIQHSAEDVIVTLGGPSIDAAFRVGSVSGFIPTSFRTPDPRGAMCFGTSCTDRPTPPNRASASGPITAYTATFEIVDSNGDLMGASGGKVVIPARAVDSPPVEYRVRMRVGSMTELQKLAAPAVYKERVVDALQYTGTPSVATTTSCVSTKVDSLGNTICTREATYGYMNALDSIELMFAPTKFYLSASVGLQGSEPLYHVADDTFVTPEFSWTGGPKDLGGY